MTSDIDLVSGGSPDRFGYEWSTYSDIKPEYEEQFRRWLPFYRPEDWRGKSFLDVGCGIGRNSFWPMSYGAAAGLAIDVDERTLASARGNLARFPTVNVQQCSAYDLDREGEFDIVFSIGVLHHLASPERALARMVAAARPGGEIAIWVYGFENNSWLLWALQPARRYVFSRLPISMTHFLSLFPTAVLWLALRLGLNQTEYFRFLRRYTFVHLRSTVFDQLLPRIAHYWRREEVERLMRDVRLDGIEITWVNEMSWAARGRKPD